MEQKQTGVRERQDRGGRVPGLRSGCGPGHPCCHLWPADPGGRAPVSALACYSLLQLQWPRQGAACQASLCPQPSAIGTAEACKQCLKSGPSRHLVSPASALGARPTPAPTPAPRCHESCMLCSCRWGLATALALSELGQISPPSKGRWPRCLEPSGGSGLWAQSWSHGRQDPRPLGVTSAWAHPVAHRRRG